VFALVRISSFSTTGNQASVAGWRGELHALLVLIFSSQVHLFVESTLQRSMSSGMKGAKNVTTLIYIAGSKEASRCMVLSSREP
jgi:hypothetical protein